MARKTKKEKIIANLRRKLLVTKNQPNKQSFPAHFPLQNPTSHLSLPTSTYLMKDLRKTFILTALAIGFEVMIYFVWK